MKCYAKDLIATAIAEIGYHEKKTNANLDNKEDNAGSNNWNKYADDIDKNYPNFYNGKKNGFHWCDLFVDWCFIKTFGYENALRLLCAKEKSSGAGCPGSYRYYKSAGRTSDTPIIGAQIFFQTDGSLTHTGIVEKFDKELVYTIEGNTSDKVARRSYYLTDKRIYGYGIPDYDTETNESANTISVPVTYDPEKVPLQVEWDLKKYNSIVLTLVNVE